jgi:membrane-bound lytic murein transglycosylase B
MRLRTPLERRVSLAIVRLSEANAALVSATSELDAANAAVTATQGDVDALTQSDRAAADHAAQTRKSLRDASVAAYVTGLGRNDLAVGLASEQLTDSMARVTYFHSIGDNLSRIVDQWNREQGRLDPQAQDASNRHGLALARVEAANAAQQAASAEVTAAQQELDQDQTLAGVGPSVVDGIPDRVLDAYVRAAQITAMNDPACRIRWWDLAAIGRTESHNASGHAIGADGTVSPPIVGPALDGNGFALIPDTDGGALDGDTVYDRAVGPMQFIPSTWRTLGVDASGDGKADPQNIYDAAYASARYLCAAAKPLPLDTEAGFLDAAYSYSHSSTYPMTSWIGSAPYRMVSQAAQ